MEAVVSAEQEKVTSVTHWLSQRIIGQETLLERLMTALLCGGHLLVEGAPGLAKTRAIKELASAVDGDFHRIQFTPDLLPSDI
ncbi:MAG: AAA family ATPase, partial [Gammaproteobacteria bacterium]|nr:AAA family ATPase [Gammaproteobacteria bacterium]